MIDLMEALRASVAQASKKDAEEGSRRKSGTAAEDRGRASRKR